MTASRQRIDALDGLRFLAIMLVALFHYYAVGAQLYRQSFFPYGTSLATIFAHGYLGVQLFFMISGFVIVMTLSRCRTLTEFAVRRLARLWPTMALAAVITFVSLSTSDTLFKVDALNFIPSLTFIEPSVFNWITGTTRFDWMDGAYWSLVVEVKFYVLVSVIYFGARQNFKQAMIIFAVLVAGLAGAASVLGLAPLRGVMQSVFISGHLSWFVIGIGGYYWFTGDRKYACLFTVVGLLSLLGYAAVKRDLVIAISAVLFTLIFYAALTNTMAEKLFSWRPIALVGAASYSFYLLHQLIGITLIDSLSSALHLSGGMAALVPLVVIFIIATLSIGIYRFYETPMNALIVSIFAQWRVFPGTIHTNA